MRTTLIVPVIGFCILPLGGVDSARAQQPQIPTLQVCNPTKVEGRAIVKIDSRSDATHSGVFKIVAEVKCDPNGLPYPDGALTIDIDMSDSIIQGTVTGVSFGQLTSTGKHTPTAYLNGRCKAAGAQGEIRGCRFWMIAADNSKNGKGTPDVVGFLVFDGTGARVAYGTGPVVKGDIHVTPSSF